MPTKKKVETKNKTTKKTEAKAPARKSAAAKTQPKTTKKAAPAPKKTVKKETKPKNQIEKILTPTNNDNVILYNDKNEALEFEQIALIPYKENLYCILRPVKLLDGMEQDEAIAFLINEDENDVWLDVVDDEDAIDDIFDIYYDLLEDANKQMK